MYWSAVSMVAFAVGHIYNGEQQHTCWLKHLRSRGINKKQFVLSVCSGLLDQRS